MKKAMKGILAILLAVIAAATVSITGFAEAGNGTALSANGQLFYEIASAAGNAPQGGGRFYDVFLKRYPISRRIDTHNNSVPYRLEVEDEFFAHRATAGWDNARALLVPSMLLSNNAYFQVENGKQPDYYVDGEGTLKDTLMRLEFDKNSIMSKQTKNNDGQIDHRVRVTFAEKVISVNGLPYQLVVVAIRGTMSDDQSWKSNMTFDVGNPAYNDYSYGFKMAERRFWRNWRNI